MLSLFVAAWTRGDDHCRDLDSGCADYIQAGSGCDNNGLGYMQQHCKMSCGLCENSTVLSAASFESVAPAHPERLGTPLQRGSNGLRQGWLHTEECDNVSVVAERIVRSSDKVQAEHTARALVDYFQLHRRIMSGEQYR